MCTCRISTNISTLTKDAENRPSITSVRTLHCTRPAVSTLPSFPAIPLIPCMPVPKTTINNSQGLPETAKGYGMVSRGEERTGAQSEVRVLFMAETRDGVKSRFSRMLGRTDIARIYRGCSYHYPRRSQSSGNPFVHSLAPRAGRSIGHESSAERILY